MSVYVISDGAGHIKIGVAKDVKSRIKTLQCGNPNNLTIEFLFYTEGAKYSDYDLEHALHKHFKQYRMRNNNNEASEWFYDDCLTDLNAFSQSTIWEIMNKHFLGKRKPLGDVFIKRVRAAKDSAEILKLHLERGGKVL